MEVWSSLWDSARSGACHSASRASRPGAMCLEHHFSQFTLQLSQIKAGRPGLLTMQKDSSTPEVFSLGPVEMDNRKEAFVNHEPHLAKQKREDFLAAIKRNDVSAVREKLESDPDVFLKEPSMLLHSPAEGMVYTLTKYKPVGTKWATDEAKDLESLGKFVAQTNLRQTFKFVIVHWPDIGEKVLNDCLMFSGKSPDDPNLKMFVSTKLFQDMEDPDAMSLKNYNAMATQNDESLVMSPFSIAFTSKYASVHFWKRILYFLVASTLQLNILAYLYVAGREEACPSYEANTQFLFIFYVVYFLLWAMFTASEIIQVIMYGKAYLSDWVNFLQWYIIFVTPYCLFTTYKSWFLTCTLLVWANLIMSLRNTRVYGKYILMTIEVIKTFCFVSIPYWTLIGSLAVASYFLFYPTRVKVALQKVIDGNSGVKTACLGNATFQNGWSTKHELDKAFPNNWEVMFAGRQFLSHINDGLGNVQINEVTKENSGLLPFGTLDPLNLIFFVFLCCCLTICFINLLIGLTVGDVEKIWRMANKEIVSLEIRQIYDASFKTRAIRKLRCGPCQRWTTAPPYLTVLPNRKRERTSDQFSVLLDYFFSDYPLSDTNVSAVCKALAVKTYVK